MIRVLTLLVKEGHGVIVSVGIIIYRSGMKCLRLLISEYESTIDSFQPNITDCEPSFVDSGERSAVLECRYQRVSPDCLPLSSGRKSNLRTCKEDDGGENGRIPNYTSFEGKTLSFRSTSPSTSQDQNISHFAVSDSPLSENHAPPKNQSHESSPTPSPSRGGDVLLQWGQNKRSRGSRTENRVVIDESVVQTRQLIKIHRRVASGMEKQSMTNQTATMLPRLPPCNVTSYSRGGNLRPCMPIRESTGSLLNRNLEERSGPGNGSQPSNGGGSSRAVSRSTDKRSPTLPEKNDRKVAGLGTPTVEKSNGSIAQAEHMNQVGSTAAPSEQEAMADTPVVAGGEKVNLDLLEWPRIYVSLSRKEKEDDFLAMKGTKLPQRPKKRAKNIDKSLQYCFPGMWLSDLTRGRYEVREKKCVKKPKRRGLKGMESMDSDSE
ncbi:hypothetical protein HHK36_023125 [Tetracentron sinense]|uniref:Uncharacterized protein n=1 Tax=Tetracentron sinense TaxID=13715 RepID=A0A835D5K4_TETSI|nr:hypothetical protein HHK36_023125 [Tetracentron sinense]